MRISGGLSLLACVAVTIPAAAGIALLWPAPSPSSARAPTAAAPTPTAPPVAADVAARFAAVRAEAAKLAQHPATAANAAAASAESGGEVARIEALAHLTERIYAARDDRRKAGQTGAELRKPFTLDELGDDLDKALTLSGAGRWLVLRDGRVLWPAGKKLPDDVDFGDPKDTKIAATTVAAAIDGAAVTLVRFCLYGEATCLLDVIAAPTAKPALVPLTPPPAADLTALDRALADAQAASTSSTAPAPSNPAASSAVGGTASHVPAPLGAAIVIACVVGALVLLIGRLRRISDDLTSLRGRVGVMAAGSASDPTGLPTAAMIGSSAHEVGELARALTEAGKALDHATARGVLDEKRRARSEEIARALVGAATLADLTARIPPGGETDDAALRGVVDAANTLIEAVDRRVLRWQSHAQAIVPRKENASALERRAEALKPLPSLLSEVSGRVMRAALVPGVPPQVAGELKTLGEALGERARTGQSLLDALLLDLATERPGTRQDHALDLLRTELSAAKTTTADRVAALGDLPPAEIAERIAASS